MATMNSNQENLYQEVLKVLQARTNDPVSHYDSPRTGDVDNSSSRSEVLRRP